MFRQALSVTMSLLLTVPLWAVSTPVGTLASSNGVTVSGTLAAPGSTLYSGDTLVVPAKGNASLMLNGGSRVLIGAGSRARVVRDGSAYALEVTRGGVVFSSSAKSLVEGRVADVTFRPKDTSKAAVGYISFKDSSHPVFFADKGAWLLTSASNGHSMVLNAGEKIEGVVSATSDTGANNQNNQGNATPNPNNKKRRFAVFWIGGAVAATATGLALAYGQSECTSPSTGSGCHVVSPVSPSGGIPQ
jgi:ferric-dicitrate binding protein FerR (iron transport regulator)